MSNYWGWQHSSMSQTIKTRVAVVGSGPAGYAAALYAARAEFAPTIFAGGEPGGQLMKTTEVENYPGYSDGVVGPQLMDEMRKQSVKFGASLVWETVEGLRIQDSRFKISTDAGTTYEYDAVILAMGAKSKLLGIGEENYYGKGFSTCAVCDAAFYRGKRVYVVGGGDAAIEDASALTKFASDVTMIVRGAEFRASRAMQKRVFDNPEKIHVMWNTNLKRIVGEKVEQLVLDVAGAEQTVPADGLFFAIGHEPATAFLRGSILSLDEKGYIKTQLNYPTQNWLQTYPTMTSVPGIFAAGDCVDFRYRQAATAAGMGVMAALDLEKWLESR